MKTFSFNLSGIKLKQPTSVAKPTVAAPPVKKFLPGETRATVGIDGFKPMRPDPLAYRSQLYSTADTRDLTPPITHIAKGCEPHPVPANQISNSEWTRKVKALQFALSQQYICTFACSLHTAEYKSSDFVGQFPEQVVLLVSTTKTSNTVSSTDSTLFLEPA